MVTQFPKWIDNTDNYAIDCLSEMTVFENDYCSYKMAAHLHDSAYVILSKY